MPEVVRSDEFNDWLGDLRDRQARARILKRIDVIEEKGHYGDHKFFGEIGELRFDFGPGYRVYFTERDGKVVILLNGGDKGSQRRDIKRSREIAKEYE